MDRSGQVSARTTTRRIRTELLLEGLVKAREVPRRSIQRFLAELVIKLSQIRHVDQQTGLDLRNHVLNLLGVWPIILSVDFYAQSLAVSACPPLPAFPYLLSCLY